jgi:hypothetical protein
VAVKQQQPQKEDKRNPLKKYYFKEICDPIKTDDGGRIYTLQCLSKLNKIL